METSKQQTIKYNHNIREYWQELLCLMVMIAIVYWYSTEIHPLAKLSYENACGMINEEELQELGYAVQGITTQYYNNNTKKVSAKIIVYDEDPTVLKHEKIHSMQIQLGRFHGCEKPIRKYFNEAEAYILQELPRTILNILYLTDKF